MVCHVCSAAGKGAMYRPCDAPLQMLPADETAWSAVASVRPLPASAVSWAAAAAMFDVSCESAFSAVPAAVVRPLADCAMLLRLLDSSARICVSRSRAIVSSASRPACRQERARMDRASDRRQSHRLGNLGRMRCRG